VWGMERIPLERSFLRNGTGAAADNALKGTASTSLVYGSHMGACMRPSSAPVRRGRHPRGRRYPRRTAQIPARAENGHGDEAKTT
jgi:hypothetical protein